jgi:TetR/AcrR family transcriptional repressor of mexJK operon
VSRQVAEGMNGSHSRKDQILDQATMLFSNHGFDGTSMRMIARASGITEAAIYRHFENKSHLYEEVIRAKAVNHSIAKLRDESTENEEMESVLTRIAHHILDLAHSDPQLMRLMFHNSIERGEFSALLFKEVRLPYIQFLSEELRSRIRKGELREVDPFITSRCFVGMVMDCALNIGVWTKMMDSQIEASDVVCNNVPIFARGLKAESVT